MRGNGRDVDNVTAELVSHLEERITVLEQKVLKKDAPKVSDEPLALPAPDEPQEG